MEKFLLFFVIVLSLITIVKGINENKNMMLIRSKKGNKRLVRIINKEKNKRKDYSEEMKAAKLLDKIDMNIQKIIDKCQETDRENVHLLKENYNSNTLQEAPEDSEHVSYSVNKGQKLAICLRNKSDNKITDINTIMFVTIHELGHIMCISKGHTDEFWSCMKFILEVAEELKLYEPINYKEVPKKYCGMEINTSPYYNKEINSWSHDLNKKK